MRDVGLLGGTFDPPHAAHVEMARAALRSGLVAEVVVVPAGDPWQKAPGTPAADRLAMTRLAFADEPFCIVDALELGRSGPTYTIDTVRALQSPHLRLHYIVGSDTLAMLPTWHRIDELTALCDFLVVKRPGSLLTPPAIEGLRVQAVAAAEMDEASTDLRAEMVQTHQRPSAVSEAVWAYILEHSLYGVTHG